MGIRGEIGRIYASCHFRNKLRVTFFTEEFSITYKTVTATLYFVVVVVVIAVVALGITR